MWGVVGGKGGWAAPCAHACAGRNETLLWGRPCVAGWLAHLPPSPSLQGSRSADPCRHRVPHAGWGKWARSPMSGLASGVLPA